MHLGVSTTGVGGLSTICSSSRNGVRVANGGMPALHVSIADVKASIIELSRVTPDRISSAIFNTANRSRSLVPTGYRGEYAGVLSSPSCAGMKSRTSTRRGEGSPSTSTTRIFAGFRSPWAKPLSCKSMIKSVSRAIKGNAESAPLQKAAREVGPLPGLVHGYTLEPKPSSRQRIPPLKFAPALGAQRGSSPQLSHRSVRFWEPQHHHHPNRSVAKS